MPQHKVIGDLSKSFALFLIILAAQGAYFAAPKVSLLFYRLDVAIHDPLCDEIYPVLVTLNNHPLIGLEETNFKVAVNDQPVQFKLIRNRVINTLILLDTSGSMATPVKIEAGKNMTRFIADTALRSGGKAALITFNDQIQLTSDWTSNYNALDLSISGLQGLGSTRLWDAIKEAATHLQTMRNSRPCELILLVVISDFEDTGSLTSREEALRSLKGTGIFGLAIVYGSFFDVNLSSAEDIARTTGGKCLRANEAKEAILQLQTLLGSIYYLEIEEKGHIKVTVSHGELSGSDEIDS